MTASSGDGVDIRGGSDIRLTDVLVNRTKDKAFSIGEGARVRIEKVGIDAGVVGIAAKDGTRVQVETARLSAIGRTGLAVFAKKARYGAASLSVKGATISARGQDTLAHGASELRVDGVRVKPIAGSLERLYDIGLLGAR